ncbi:protein kinase domain-containing protein [Streptosporangium subroseum]|uniref:protein kinase domain-containing protein n=1 Tax=Streptosporangium subroseum TaxID=106412 RepID=UPI00308982FC|nr:protein kinase [Streptosporangium subroseum]
MSDPLPPVPEDLEQVGGYRLIRRLGSGGQGVVYLGRAPAGGDVAVKVLHSWMADDADARRRFLREVDVARRVAPFCTARVLDMGLHGNRPYIVSEYVPGLSLHQLVKTDGPRSGGGLDRLAIATISALAGIHRAGIVHRDFKPGNVILGPEGPVVIDFGISRALDHTVTGTGSIGTPPYMAPEQFTDESPGYSADIFSWACTMVYAATGHRAFPGETVPAIVNAILYREPDLSGVPEMLRPLLAACLAKNPAERPATADVFRILTGDGAAPPPPGTSERSPLGFPPGTVQESPPGTSPESPPGFPSGTARESSPGFPAASPFVPPAESATSPAPPAESTFAPSPAPPIASMSGTSLLPPPETATVPSGGSRRAGGISRRALAAAAVGVVAIAAALILPPLLRETTATGQGTSEIGTTLSPSTGTSVSPAATGGPVAAPFGAPLYDHPLADHSNDVRSIAIGRMKTTPVAITGGDDTTTRVFDLAGGRQLGDPLTGHTGWVRSIAFGELRGAPIALTGSDDDTVRVWDLTKGKEIGKPFTEHTGDVKAVAIGEVNGAPVAITGGADRTVRVWDIATGVQLYAAMTGHTNTVWSIAYGEVGGKPVAVSGSGDNTLRVWDLTSGRQLGDPLTGHTGEVRSVTFGQVKGAPVVISGSDDATIRIWDLTSGRQLGDPLTGHDGTVWAVASGEVNDIPIAVSGGEDRTVRVWNLLTGQRVGSPFTGHTDRVWAVAVGQVGGAPVAVSGSRDETVRVWSLAPPFPAPGS